MKYSYLSDTVEIKKIEEKGNVGVFHVEGLYTGYGATLANALRRALLSSIPGAAVSSVRVKGVKHEFSTIPGMKEDVVEFSLNLKSINFHFRADEPQVVKLKARGPGEITASAIAETPMVEVVNKDLHLATLTDKKSELEAELVIEKGLGYAPAESRQSERLPIGTIILDCVFSPVIGVAFEVEDMRVGERTDYNRIVLTIETDGSITPTRALRQASNILKDHFSKIAELEGGKDDDETEEIKSTKNKKTKKTATKKKAIKKKTTKKKK